MMMEVTIHAAKTNLSKLIEVVLLGEEVVIFKGKRPVVKIVPVEPRKAGFTIGILKSELAGTDPDFLEPMSEDELALWEGAK